MGLNTLAVTRQAIVLLMIIILCLSEVLDVSYSIYSFNSHTRLILFSPPFSM